MLPKTAVFALLAAASCFAGQADAAIFRIQGATTNSDGTFTAGGVNYRVSGEFRVLTNHNSTPEAGKQLQAWNILVKDTSGNVLNRFVNGYSAAVMGGYTDNSTKGADSTNSFSLTCNTTGSGCTDTNNLSLAFSANFNDFIGDSYSPATARFASIQTAGTSYLGSAPTAVNAQADFVPFNPAIAGLLPLIGLLSRLRKTRGIQIIKS